MNAKALASSPTDEVSLELKYCERCGGLWLRPVGGGQIYCVTCGRAMGELPRGPNDLRRRRGVRWETNDEGEGWDGEDGIDVETAGGVA
jgi:hypothetical protein